VERNWFGRKEPFTVGPHYQLFMLVSADRYAWLMIKKNAWR